MIWRYGPVESSCEHVIEFHKRLGICWLFEGNGSLRVSSKATVHRFQQELSIRRKILKIRILFQFICFIFLCLFKDSRFFVFNNDLSASCVAQCPRQEDVNDKLAGTWIEEVVVTYFKIQHLYFHGDDKHNHEVSCSEKTLRTEIRSPHFSNMKKWCLVSETRPFAMVARIVRITSWKWKRRLHVSPLGVYDVTEAMYS
jgi:hypothetical protein